MIVVAAAILLGGIYILFGRGGSADDLSGPVGVDTPVTYTTLFPAGPSVDEGANDTDAVADSPVDDHDITDENGVVALHPHEREGLTPGESLAGWELLLRTDIPSETAYEIINASQGSTLDAPFRAEIADRARGYALATLTGENRDAYPWLSDPRPACCTGVVIHAIGVDLDPGNPERVAAFVAWSGHDDVAEKNVVNRHLTLTYTATGDGAWVPVESLY